MKSSDKHQAFRLAHIFAVYGWERTAMESLRWFVSWVVRFGVPTV